MPPGHAPLQTLQEIPTIGETLPGATINAATLTHLDILLIVQFYNDNFEIQLGDTVPIRSQKIENWLTMDI